MDTGEKITTKTAVPTGCPTCGEVVTGAFDHAEQVLRIEAHGDCDAQVVDGP